MFFKRSVGNQKRIKISEHLILPIIKSVKHHQIHTLSWPNPPETTAAEKRLRSTTPRGTKERTIRKTAGAIVSRNRGERLLLHYTWLRCSGAENIKEKQRLTWNQHKSLQLGCVRGRRQASAARRGRRKHSRNTAKLTHTDTDPFSRESIVPDTKTHTRVQLARVFQSYALIRSKQSNHIHDQDKHLLLNLGIHVSHNTRPQSQDQLVTWTPSASHDHDQQYTDIF